MKKLAEAFYNDTYLFDQNACSAPQIAGELTKEEVTQERIMKCIMADNGKEA